MRPIDAEAFKKYIDAQEGRPFIGCTVGEAMKILIDEQPTIQCEPKKGHWIWVAGELVCSECHTIYSDLYPDYDNAVACPHCGAKMTISK